MHKQNQKIEITQEQFLLIHESQQYSGFLPTSPLREKEKREKDIQKTQLQEMDLQEKELWEKYLQEKREKELTEKNQQKKDLQKNELREKNYYLTVCFYIYSTSEEIYLNFFVMFTE